jgi:hypothetical protein
LILCITSFIYAHDIWHMNHVEFGSNSNSQPVGGEHTRIFLNVG